MAYDKETWRASHKNGQINLSELEQIVPTFYDSDISGPAVMHPEAAAAMSAWIAEAKASGHGDLGVKYSYRPIQIQWVKWNAYVARGKTPPIVAYPGTSNHGWAVSVDLKWLKSATIEWAHRTAAKYGFEFDVPSENWHATYQGGWKDEDAMSFAEFKEGVRAAKNGNTLPANASVDFAFGYNMEKRATSEPKPGTPGPHTHEGTVKLT